MVLHRLYVTHWYRLFRIKRQAPLRSVTAATLQQGLLFSFGLPSYSYSLIVKSKQKLRAFPTLHLVTARARNEIYSPPSSLTKILWVTDKRKIIKAARYLLNQIWPPQKETTSASEWICNLPGAWKTESRESYKGMVGEKPAWVYS